MELHQLRYFVAVAQTGSFTRAAELCLISQPSLSQQVKKLEDGLGQRLLDRLGKRAALTDAGKALLERATHILAAVDNAERQLKDFDQSVSGRLAIGAIPTVAPYLLPDALRAFTRAYPSVELIIQEDLTAHLLAAAAAGDLDLALVALPITDDRLAVEPLFTEPLLLALPLGHRFQRGRVSLNEVREERFIVLDEMHCLGEQLQSICNEAGCQRIACRSSQLSTVQTLIALGQGVSLLPAMAQAADRSRRVAYRPLAEPQPTRTIVAVWHKYRYHSTAAEFFLGTLKEQARGM
jgi:LysR family transcriptional regulator, hydrogen peroxide-inducible genes activator